VILIAIQRFQSKAGESHAILYRQARHDACPQLSILAASLAAHAQPSAKVPTIGHLALRAGPAAEDEAFKQGLRDLGWLEGQTIAMEYRWAAGQMDHLPTLAEELVRLQVDCIVAWSTPVVQAAKDATQTMPIVMTWVADPIRSGFVASLARPRGNITGTSNIQPELAGKKLELLRALLPNLSRVAFLAHGGEPVHRLFLHDAQDAAARFGMQLQPAVIGSLEELESAFAARRREQTEALIVQPLLMVDLGQGQRIAGLAVQHHLLTISDGNQFAVAGGLLFYGPDRLALLRCSVLFVDKILKGAKPVDLPVEQPTKFALVINLKTAQALGLTIPPTLLFQADEVMR
jgi:putative tryptophan/tyrosine transport system substrate-binding protein